jgi:carbamoyltransferase
LNCVANGLISRERIFKKIFVQPAAGDAGGALGAALFTWHQILGNARNISEPDGQHASLLGTSYSQPNVIELFQSMKLPFRIYDSTELPQQVAQLLIEGRVIGFFDGRMEFGPRALGGRSIIGDPRIATMQTTMNVKIKFRESFRPFAPSIMAEHATEYFDLSEESPYMLLVAPVQATHLKPIPSDMEETMGLEKLKMERSDIPAVTHVDGSARVQTVDATRFPRFHSILKTFYAATGCPVVINTSFNIRGEPIVGASRCASSRSAIRSPYSSIARRRTRAIKAPSSATPEAMSGG